MMKSFGQVHFRPRPWLVLALLALIIITFGTALTPVPAAGRADVPALTSTPTAGGLRYDGLYTAGNYYYWLRFYEDGAVIYGAGQVNESDILGFNEVFTIDWEWSDKGTYSLEGSELTLSTTSASGDVTEQEGTIEGDTLILNVHYANDYEEELVYEFLEMPSAEQPTESPADVPPTAAPPSEPGDLRFDGLYHQMNSFGWLRFLEDGTVLTVPLQSATASEALEWLADDCEDCGRGTYTIQDSQIKFSSTTAQGTVDYNGTIQKDALILDTLSHINGYESTGVVFEFIDPAEEPTVPTASPTPNPTIVAGPGIVLYLSGGDTEFLSEEGQGIGQFLLYGDNDAKEFSYPLAGDIDGTTYTFSLWLASAGTTTFEASIVVLQDGSETVLAAAPFTVSSDQYEAFVATVEGIDPDTVEGDTLILRVSSSSALQAGQIKPGGLAYGADTASYIKIPPVE